MIQIIQLVGYELKVGLVVDVMLNLGKVLASRQSKQEKAIWQRRFWEHLIRDEQNYFINHVDYK